MEEAELGGLEGGDSTAVVDEPTLLPGSPFLAALGRGDLKLFPEIQGEVSRASSALSSVP